MRATAKWSDDGGGIYVQVAHPDGDRVVRVYRDHATAEKVCCGSTRWIGAVAATPSPEERARLYGEAVARSWGLEGVYLDEWAETPFEVLDVELGAGSAATVAESVRVERPPVEQPKCEACGDRLGRPCGFALLNVPPPDGRRCEFCRWEAAHR